jgi:hypothetical protein
VAVDAVAELVRIQMHRVQACCLRAHEVIPDTVSDVEAARYLGSKRLQR